MRKDSKELYYPYVKQLLFHKAHEHSFETLYGGSAGGGKSQAILFDAYMTAIKHPGIRIIIFRRTYPQLEKSHIFYSKNLFTSDMGKYSEKNKVWKIYTSGQPSYIEFGHCKSEDDVFNYHSAQYDAMYFDELTHFTEFQYTYLLTRIRPNVVKSPLFVKSAANPGGIGHAWVRKRWSLQNKDKISFLVYKPEYVENIANLNLKIPSRCFIPATVYDNNYIMENDPDYVERLKSSPFSKQLLEGDWGTFSGQAFPEFDKNIHTCKPFKIPQSWDRWVGIDYGYSKPFAALWFARDPNSGRIYVYRELYLVGVRDVTQAQKIVEVSGSEKINYYVADPSIFAPRGSGSSIAEVYERNGVMPLIKGNNKRVAGKIRFQDYLARAKDGKGWIVFFETCENTIRTIPELILDERNVEDVNTRQEDHCYDSIRYFLMSLETPTRRSNFDELTLTQIDDASRREWENVRRTILKRQIEDNNCYLEELNRLED